MKFLLLMIFIGCISGAQLSAAAEPAKKSLLADKFGVGLGIALPEIISLEAFYKFRRRFHLKFYASPSTSHERSVTVKERTVGTALGYKAVVEEKDISFTANFGPHFGLDGIYFPIVGSNFYIAGGFGIRFLDFETDDNYRIFICSESAGTCNDENSVTSPISVDVKGHMKATSYLARFSVGWQWFWSKQLFFNFIPIGISMPVYTERSADLDTELSTSGSSVFEGLLNSLLQSAVDEGEKEAEEDTEKEMAPFDKRPLPIMGVTVGYFF